MNLETLIFELETTWELPCFKKQLVIQAALGELLYNKTDLGIATCNYRIMEW